MVSVPGDAVTRCYVPTTLEILAVWRDSGAIPSLDEGFVADDDSEEAEYDALMNAADASAALNGRDLRRVVVVVEVGASVVGPVETAPADDIVAVHADDIPREADADHDDDLSWHATQEIPDLLV